AAEPRALVVCERRPARLAARDELDDTRVVAGSAALGRDDLEAEPLAVARPARDPFAIDLAARGLVVARDEGFDVAAHVRGVARTHECERGGRRRAGDDRITARGLGGAAAAGARVGHASWYLRSVTRILVLLAIASCSHRDDPPADRVV